MQSHLNRSVYRAALAALMLICLPLVAVAQNQSGEASEPPWMLLVFYATDQKCGILNNQENRDLRAIIDFGMSMSGFPEEEAARAWEKADSGELSADMPCEGSDLDELTVIVRELIASMNKRVTESQTLDPKNLTGLDAIAGQIDFMSDLASGQLSALEGCWRGIVGVWESEFCFGPGGDALTISTAPPNQAFSCRLEGQARLNQGNMVMYALPIAPSCQQAGQLSHFAGGCQPVRSRLECRGAFSKNAEDTYTDDSLDIYIAGQFALARNSADILTSIQETFDVQTADIPRGMLGRADGCKASTDFFGTRAELCFDAATDLGRLTIADPACILEGEALRTSEEFVVAGLWPTEDCTPDRFAIITAGCTEIAAAAMDCTLFGLQDGFSFADRYTNDVRVPMVGNATFASDPPQ